jgi:hypothetical protein
MFLDYAASVFEYQIQHPNLRSKVACDQWRPLPVSKLPWPESQPVKML